MTHTYSVANISPNRVVEIFGYTKGYHKYGDYIVILVDALEEEHLTAIRIAGHSIQKISGLENGILRVEIRGIASDDSDDVDGPKTEASSS